MAKLTLANGTIFEGTPAEIREWMEMGDIVAQAPKARKARKATGSATAVADKVEFTTRKGEVKLVSAAQAAVWEAHRNRQHENLDEVKAKSATAMQGYKPSKELKEALKANPVMTTKQAKELGFPKYATGKDLKALKLKLKVYDK